MTTLSIVSPVYMTEQYIVPLYQRLVSTCDSINNLTSFEIVFVDDGSRDNSWSQIVTLAKQDPRVRALKLSRNFGQHKALAAGLENCSGDWVVVMDCDLQNRPEDIPLLWNKALEGYEVINARRVIRKDSRWKKCTSRLYFLALKKLTGLPYDGTVGNFRLINRKVVDALKLMGESTKSLGLQIQWLGFSTAYVDVVQPERINGRSSYNFLRLLTLAVDTIVSFSNKPLYVSIVLGKLIVAASFSIMSFLIARKYFYDIPVSGWTSLIVAIFGLSGIIILNLGIIGLYIAKIYEESKRRPVFIISDRINSSPDIRS